MSNTRDFGEQPNDETSSFPHQTTENYEQAPYVPSGGVYTVPPQSQAPKRRAGVGTAFAVALVTALAAGAGAVSYTHLTLPTTPYV